MTTYKTILLAIVLCVLGSVLPVQASSHAHEEDASVNVKDIIFDHIGDAYEWHVTTIGDKHVSIPLPVIVFSKEKGFHTFLSHKLHHGESYEGFHIAT